MLSELLPTAHLTNGLLASLNPIEHVLDRELEGWGGFSMQLMTLCIAAIIAVLCLTYVTKAMATGPSSMGNRRYLTRGRLAQIVEVLVVGLRDGMIKPILGPEQTVRYLPFLLSLFFFILAMNLMGLIPFMDIAEFFGWWRGSEPTLWIGGTPTSNIAVNAALASVVFVVVQAQAMREIGLKGWFEHLCGGKELLYGPKGLLFVVPIIFVVEFLGLFVKPCALTIRLFANMVGGHTLLATLFLFGTMARNEETQNQIANWLMVGGISAAAGAFALFIMFMELFVAFLQAFIFMLLTAVFIAEMSHHDEHDEGADEAGHHDHAPAHAH
ncbi:MAG: F0F1 ATP synthase subunit A [Phycisphaerales bacterium]